MTDRELLELAAKAAGYSTANYFDGEFMGADRYEFCDGPHGWNPLRNSHDAFCLAVKLKFDIEWDSNEVSVNDTAAEFELDDPYAATRRAIVRAAAEIGKTI